MQLGDKRLERVLAKFSDRIRQRQSLSMRSLATNRNEEVQFGRFLSNARVSVPSLESVLYEQCRQSASASTHVLLIEDTTQLAFSMQRKIEGLGKVDKGIVQGYYLHPVLTLDADTGACHGVAALEGRVRPQQDDGLTYPQRRKVRDKECFEDKETYRWQSSIQKALQSLPATVDKTVVADREADIYALLVGLQQELGVDYVIRSRIDRTVTAGGKLSTVFASQPVQAQMELDLPASEGRGAHRALLQVRYGQVELKRTASPSRSALPPTWQTWVVWVQEADETVPKGQVPVSWVLLSSHPVTSIAQALRVIDFYKQRWNVEQLFRLLKTRCLRFESSQLSEYEKLQKLMLVALMGAVKVLQLLRARQGQTEQPLSAVFGQHEQVFLQRLSPALEGRTSKQKNPYPVQSLAFGAWVVARLAGWSGYQSQRPPGPTDFFEGMQRFYDQWQGFLLIEHNCVYT